MKSVVFVLVATELAFAAACASSSGGPSASADGGDSDGQAASMTAASDGTTEFDEGSLANVTEDAAVSDSDTEGIVNDSAVRDATLPDTSVSDAPVPDASAGALANDSAPFDSAPFDGAASDAGEDGGAPSPQFVAVSAGGESACAITSSGGVMCWGNNNWGDLGNGSTTMSPVPVQVVGLTSGATAVSVGDDSACAVVDGGVVCWGQNGAGQLGNNSTTDSAVPVQVVGLTSGATAVSVGSEFACAIVNGGVECWGTNGIGQLGNDSTTNSTVPVQVVGLASGVTGLATAIFYACAIAAGGGVQCWGQIDAGDGSTGGSPVPAQVAGLTSGITAISAGDAACVVTAGGGVECWGNNANGNLGNGSTTNSAVPVQVTGLTAGIAAVSVGTDDSACALGVNGNLFCWGDDSHYQLGSTSATGGTVPVPFTALASGVTAVSVGGGFGCALLADGSIACWGNGIVGELGNGYTTSSPVPVKVGKRPSGVIAVSVGANSVCDITTAGSVECWGDNSGGELGNGSTGGTSAVPVLVTTLVRGITAISVGGGFACAITEGGGVECWGAGGDGELGNGALTSSPIPVQVTGLTSGVTAISAGGSYACAIVADGAVECWGGGTDIGGSSVPAPVSGLTSGVIAISSGVLSACALTAGGDIECWGSGNDLGSSVRESSVPLQVMGLSGAASAVSTGGQSACAIVGDTVECWGYGDLGNGSSMLSYTAVQVMGLTGGVDALSAGGAFACVILPAGGVECWGGNESGQLGINSTTDSLVPAQVSGLTAGVSSLSAGYGTACIVTSNGVVQCWGDNSSNQLANDSISSSPVPIPVAR